MKPKPRVLLLSATSGAGHVRAAQALEKAFQARGDCAVEHIDALQHVSKFFQRVYDKAYISMVRRAPELRVCSMSARTSHGCTRGDDWRWTG
jgi:UDP-N-acetylglucosamine:LPS N-acetylglucosamine transferase